MADPEFYALRQSFWDFRRLGHDGLLRPVADEAIAGKDLTQDGPVSVLLQRANSVGIAWSPSMGMFQDGLGPPELFLVAPQHLKCALCGVGRGVWQRSLSTAKVLHQGA